MTRMSYCLAGGIGDWIVYWQLSHTFSLIHYLELVLSVTEPVLNEWSCPLLTLMNVIASTLVSCAVSVVHQCDSQCVLAEQETTSRIEREPVTRMQYANYATLPQKIGRNGIQLLALQGSIYACAVHFYFVCCARKQLKS